MLITAIAALKCVTAIRWTGLESNSSTDLNYNDRTVKMNQFPQQVPQYLTSTVQRGGSDTQWTSGRRSDAGTPGRENWPTNSCNKQFDKNDRDNNQDQDSNL